MPSVCLGGAWHGMAWHKMGTVCKTHTLWPKHGKHVQSRVTPSTGTHLSPIHHKMSLERFVKHLACSRAQHKWTMHEHKWKSLNTLLECHTGPTQIHKDQIGLSPIKILEIFSQNHEPLPIFEKSLILETLTQFLNNLRQKRRKCFRKHTLKLKMQKTSLRVKMSKKWF